MSAPSKRIAAISAPRPTGDSQTVTVDYVERLVPVIDKIGAELTKSDADLNSRIKDIEAGVSTSKVQHVYVSGLILDAASPALFYLVHTSAGNVSVTLPAASTAAGKVLTFKKMDAANTLTIRVGAGTVEGAATVSWATNGEVQGFVSDGSAWWRVVSA